MRGNKSRLKYEYMHNELSTIKEGLRNRDAVRWVVGIIEFV